MDYTIEMMPTGEVEVPSPEVYWMEGFGEWECLRFQSALIRSGKNILLLNTGFPPDIAPLAAAWREFLGERCILRRPDEWMIEAHLAARGLSPDDITHVFITPIQLYATGNLGLFRNAQICLSRRGWVEDIMAPTYPHHVPRQGCLSDEHLRWLLFENQRNLLLMDDLHELLPGLTCRWVGVHHRSSMLVEVRTSVGQVMLSDCAFHYANVEESRPLGIAESIIEAHAAYADIRRRADVFIPLYDPQVQERFPNGKIT